MMDQIKYREREPSHDDDDDDDDGESQRYRHCLQRYVLPSQKPFKLIDLEML